jgi:hypothetical protein
VLALNSTAIVSREQEACFVVPQRAGARHAYYDDRPHKSDADGQQLAHIYFEEEQSHLRSAEFVDQNSGGRGSAA